MNHSVTISGLSNAQVSAAARDNDHTARRRLQAMLGLAD